MLRDNSDDRETTQRLADACSAFDAASVAVINAESSGLQIVDHPDLGPAAGPHEDHAFGGIGGMMAGVTVSLMALILIMARDRSIRTSGPRRFRLRRHRQRAEREVEAPSTIG